MGNPIQYRNTDNPSQIEGWVSHNKGGFHKMASVRPGGTNNAFIVIVRPPGRTQWGLMKTFHRVKKQAWNMRGSVGSAAGFNKMSIRQKPNEYLRCTEVFLRGGQPHIQIINR